MATQAHKDETAAEYLRRLAKTQLAKVRCEPCTGTGIKGRWRTGARGRSWKIEACRACGGCGERFPTKRDRMAGQ